MLDLIPVARAEVLIIWSKAAGNPQSFIFDFGMQTLAQAENCYPFLSLWGQDCGQHDALYAMQAKGGGQR